ncbi:MAG TPA: acyl-CoA dehydrogenase family protein, partial [Caulobacteraceae bacterium]|nr:acyl-CoA dehydrogenase family protein [Caulobacteraceae bacterium]
MSEDDRLIVDSLLAFGAERLRPEIRTAEGARAVSADVRAAFAELGFEALELPEAAGGAGLGMLSRVRANRALARADAGAAVALDRLGPALYPLLAFGGEAAALRFARPLLDDPAARAVLVVE